MLIVLLLCCLYGGGMFWLLANYERLQQNKLLHLAHLIAFAGQVGLWLFAAGAPSGGMMGATAGAAVLLFGLAFICVVNAPVLSMMLSSYLSDWFLAIGGVQTRRSYDKAEAARRRGDVQKAEELYREIIRCRPESEYAPPARKRLNGLNAGRSAPGMRAENAARDER
jgi:hypothetical protein